MDNLHKTLLTSLRSSPADFSWIKNVVVELNESFVFKRDGTYTNAVESLLNERRSLLELEPLFLKFHFVNRFRLLLTEDRAEVTAQVERRWVVRYDNEEVLAHYVDFGSKRANEFDVLTQLDAHEVVVLQRFPCAELFEVGLNIEAT